MHIFSYKNLAEWKGNIQAYRYGKHNIKVYWAIFGPIGPNLEIGIKEIVEIINACAIQLMN